MKKKEKELPKLTLNKETLRELTLTPSLAPGGQQIDSAWPSCPSVCATC